MPIDSKLKRKIELVKEIFPDGCPILPTKCDSSQLSFAAVAILDYAVEGENKALQVEHPCYGCKRSADECLVRQVAYHDISGRWINRQA